MPGLGSPPTRRRAWYAGPGRQRRLARPVVSVGNVSMGGRGKTPLVAHIARLLLAAGERPAVLTRGYRRRHAEPGVVVVSDGQHLLADLDRAGDEPLMLAQAVPGAIVCVSAQRALAGALAERALGATVHLLDDGFQHLALARDLDIVIVSPDDFRDRPLPFGRLREPVTALSAADAVVFDSGLEGLPTPASGGRIFAMRRSLGDPVALEDERTWPGDSRGPVVAVAGIADPQRFIHALSVAGWRVTRALTFRDHHRFSRADVAAIAGAVEETGARGVVTTEKDAVRLLPWRPLPVPVAALPLQIHLDPPGAFDAWLIEHLRQVRG